MIVRGILIGLFDFTVAGAVLLGAIFAATLGDAIFSPPSPQQHHGGKAGAGFSSPTVPAIYSGDHQ